MDLLEMSNGKFPALTRFAGKRDPKLVWRQLRKNASEVTQWATHIGQELLGRPVVVRKYFYGLGRTREDRTRQAAEIEISDVPVTSGHPYGEDVMRGLVLHELGHHLYDIGMPGHKTTRGIARSEGIDVLYDILCDERLERKLRARREQWGCYFDRLAAYAFAEHERLFSLEEFATLVNNGQRSHATMQKLPQEMSAAAVRAAIANRQLPGEIVPMTTAQPLVRVRLRDQELMAIPGATPILGAFLLCLRGGIAPLHYPNPQLMTVLKHVPRNLKNLSHAGILQVARHVAAALWGEPTPKEVTHEIQKLLQLFPHAMLGKHGAFNGKTSPNTPHDRDRVPIRQEQPPVGKPCSPRTAQRRPLSLNLDPTTTFPVLTHDSELSYDADSHFAVVKKIQPHLQLLRGYLNDLNAQEKEIPASRQGHRIDIAQVRKLVYRPTVNLLVRSETRQHLDHYLGIVIDGSDSMAGERMERAIAFAVLLSESAKGIRGIEGHINAFDGETFYRLGDLQQTSVASLWARGGNNDAGALARAADLAVQSRKRHKTLIMISDGTPSQCSFASLATLVRHLTRAYHLHCIQVAVAPIERVAFPRYVDLSRSTLDQAVRHFGRLLVQIASE
jgi:hypothetical protein